MSGNIIDNLDKLTPEELAKVGNLINKFADRHEREEEQPQPKPNRKRNRKKRQREVDNTSERLIVEHGPGRKKPRRRVVADEYEEVEHPRRVGRGRTAPRNPRNQARSGRNANRGRRDRGGGGVMAHTESVKLSNENRFMKMRERNTEKGDVNIDRKLWSGRMPTQRPEEYEDVEVQCKECQLWFDVNPSLVLIDYETKEPNFTCNNCSPRGR